ncbi:MAG: sigma-70 family RNA polymerase sigma factor [Candidatus Omnitrophica bacterium]|nr:sigma-70 family RNA polymerase sigma factor [Candidatus Omnitrophota bacterium]
MSAITGKGSGAAWDKGASAEVPALWGLCGVEPVSRTGRVPEVVVVGAGGNFTPMRFSPRSSSVLAWRGRVAAGPMKVAWDVILPFPMAGSDAETIQAVLRGDVDRYAELVDQYQGQAIRLAFSLLGNYEDAKDASQEAFVSAYRSLGQFRGGAKFSTWLYRIVVNECKDVYRRRARQPVASVSVGDPGAESQEDSGLFIEVDDPAAGPDEQAEQRELSQRLSRTIALLPMKQRTAFLLHHVHGLPLEEVAQVMGCRAGTVKSHVFRATEHLRNDLAPWLKQEGRIPWTS